MRFRNPAAGTVGPEGMPICDPNCTSGVTCCTFGLVQLAILIPPFREVVPEEHGSDRRRIVAYGIGVHEIKILTRSHNETVSTIIMPGILRPKHINVPHLTFDLDIKGRPQGTLSLYLIDQQFRDIDVEYRRRKGHSPVADIEPAS